MGPFLIEFYYKGDCIEQREYNVLPFDPQVGDIVRIEFQNSNYSEQYGSWWIVNERRILFPSIEHGNKYWQTLMLNVTPDQRNGGIWKTDPAHK